LIGFIGTTEVVPGQGRGIAEVFELGCGLEKGACDEHMVARCGLGYEFGDGELRLVGADGDYDYGAGDGVPGEWGARVGDGAGELAGVYDGGGFAGGGWFDGGDGGIGWVSEREPGSECGGESGGTLLYGGVSSGGWDGEYAVLGGSGGGYGDFGLGAGAVDARG
jgi:hypothetical protein